MALQLGALRDALKEAGASDAMARAAAEEVAGYENRLVGIEQALTELRADVGRQLAELRAEFRSEVRMLRWMNATTLALVLAVLVKLFVH